MRIRHLLFFLSVASGIGFASTSFAIFPLTGALTALPGETTGWGYSIDNQTLDYLVPYGLSNSGVVNGTLTDIFDYPVVNPGQTIDQDYVFNSPGGFGNSLGLYEYTVPTNAPPGFIESGTFVLSYQLYNSNPDFDPSWVPVGPVTDLSAPFSLTVETASTPESGSWALVTLGLALCLARAKVRRFEGTVFKSRSLYERM
ncbi:MAG: hypothetical protein ABSB35_33650 [Bryobacteraceae bacterium]|jgi:hypothetical protein